jgi:hypothetical protein
MIKMEVNNVVVQGGWLRMRTLSSQVLISVTVAVASYLVVVIVISQLFDAFNLQSSNS